MICNQINPLHQQQDNFGEAISWFVIRGVQLFIFFTYITGPLWGAWLANQLGIRAVLPHDMLLAMAWLPVSCGITALSFMKHGGQNLKRGWASFILLNAIVISAACWYMF